MPHVNMILVCKQLYSLMLALVVNTVDNQWS